MAVAWMGRSGPVTHGSLAAPSDHTPTPASSQACDADSRGASFVRGATGVRLGASWTRRQMNASVTSPGTIASRKSRRSAPGQIQRNAAATSGPSAAPAWSIARMWPKARPRTAGSTRSATRASRGPLLIPLPKRSAARTRIAPAGEVTSPISGRTTADSP